MMYTNQEVINAFKYAAGELHYVALLEKAGLDVGHMTSEGMVDAAYEGPPMEGAGDLTSHEITWISRSLEKAGDPPFTNRQVVEAFRDAAGWLNYTALIAQAGLSLGELAASQAVRHSAYQGTAIEALPLSDEAKAFLREKLPDRDVPEVGVLSRLDDFDALPLQARQVVTQALRMLGFDWDVYDDALADEQRRLTTGFVLGTKDIVCADLVTISLKAAGLALDWPVTEPPNTPYVSTHAANFYRLSALNPRLKETTDPDDWKPGDILIYGDGDAGDQGFLPAALRVKHVNLYVGRFSGVDISKRLWKPESRWDVVNASLDTAEPLSREIRPMRHSDCKRHKFGYDWYRHLRLVELEQVFSETPT